MAEQPGGWGDRRLARYQCQRARHLKTFNDGQSVASYFNDKPVDLGPLSGAAFASGTVDLPITLKVTADAAGSGFTGGFIVTG